MIRLSHRLMDWNRLLDQMAWEGARHTQTVKTTLDSAVSIYMVRKGAPKALTRFELDLPDAVAEEVYEYQPPCPWRTVKPKARIHPGWSISNPRWQEVEQYVARESRRDSERRAYSRAYQRQRKADRLVDRTTPELPGPLLPGVRGGHAGAGSGVPLIGC